MVSPIQWTWVWAHSGIVKDREAWFAALLGLTESGMNSATEKHNTLSYTTFHTVPILEFYCCCVVANSGLTLCDPRDCSLPGSSVHGISSGKNTGVGCHFFLQGIFQTQRLNPHLLLGRQILYHWATWETPILEKHNQKHTMCFIIIVFRKPLESSNIKKERINQRAF